MTSFYETVPSIDIHDHKEVNVATTETGQSAARAISHVFLGILLGALPDIGPLVLLVLAMNTYDKDRYLSYQIFCQGPMSFLIGLALTVIITLICLCFKRIRLIGVCSLVTLFGALGFAFFLLLMYGFGSDSYMGMATIASQVH